MSQCLCTKAFVAAFIFIIIAGTSAVQAGSLRTLHGHLPAAEALSQPLGHLPGANSLRLAISLPLRNSDALTNLLQRLYDPNSPDYHHYLTPAQFSEQFGPTEQDYQKVIQFASSNGLEIVNRRDSRMLLDVRGKSANVEKAFHVNLRAYQHPTENRQFYAPNVEPSVDSDLPILDIHGLESYSMLRPALHPRAVKPPGSVPAGGSQQPDGWYLGSDFRNAYAPGVPLNGAGQMVGLVELDGYYTSDITNYEHLAGFTNVPLIPVPLNGYDTNSTPGGGNVEVSLDIEMAIAMAPALSAVVIFQAPDSPGTTGWMDILDSMASSNQIKQFSSSWGYTGAPDPNTTFDTQFQKMATQGQSFYQASGDGDAWINPIWVPGDSPYVISVGGTSLTMTNSGALYVSEMVWNYGNQGSGNGWSANTNTGHHRSENDYVGSGGGGSTVYSIPSWQTNAINSTNHGSTSARNIPDVALTADGIWVTYGNGQSNAFAGTSCAAPLWAGFTALINQQAAAGGHATVGFINPAIYAIGQSSSYSSVFHDITSGNNTNAQSTNRFTAVAGYDLCTGWGTPNGAALINALLPNSLQVTPAAGFASTGPYGGPFSVTNQTFVLTNTGAASLSWSLVNTSLWLSASSSNGTLASNGPAATVSINLNSTVAAGLAAGVYTNTVLFSNATAALAQSVQFSLTISKATPVLNWVTPAAITYGAALSPAQLDATANVPGAFVYSPSNGAVLTAGAHALSVTFTPSDSTDYNTTATNTSLTVSTAPLTATAGNAGRPYGTANPAFSGTITGVTNGDNITATYSCSATSNSPVATYFIVPALVDPNNRRTNYTVTLNNGTLTVNKATPTLNWPAPTPVIYGTALGSNQLNAAANTVGNFAYNPPGGTVMNTGTNLLSVAFTPSDTVDYNSTGASVNLAVTPAPLTVTASNASQTYGQPLPPFGGTIAGVTNDDNITATYSCSATSNSPVATYPIVPALVDPNNLETNYTVTLNNGMLTVNKATPTLNWPAPAPVIYGTALGSNQLNAAANTPGNFAYNPPGGTVLNSGTNLLSVAFTPSDTVDYNNTGAGVNLAVTPAPLTVTASNASQVYGQAVPSFGGTITGLTNGDNITATYSCSATSNSPVGAYPIVPALVDPNNLETNYTVSLNDGTLTVTMATPTLSWAAPAAVIYGTALDTNQLNATADVPGNFVYNPPAGTAPGPGTNTLSVFFTPNDPVDYTNASASVNLVVTIAPIPLNIQLVNNSVVLTWSDPASVFALQAAPSVTGVFTNVPGASSPYTNYLTDDQQFFQLAVPGN